MKKMTVLSLMILVNLGSVAFADTTVSYSGTGSVFTPGGQKLGDYTVKSTEALSSAGVKTIDTTVTIPNEEALQIHSVVTPSGSGFKIESNYGNGGSSCYGNGLCESYIVGSGGLAYAATIVQDAPGHRRVLRTALENGRAVQVFQESYDRLN